MKVILTILLATMFLFSVGQEEKMKQIRGKVINLESGLEISDVTVCTMDSAYSVKTLKLGRFFIKVPCSTDALVFSHEDYQTKVFKSKSLKRVINIGLRRIKPDSVDLPQFNNTISFLPLKLITGAFSMRLERFIKTKYSGGMYITYYYNGRQYFGSEEFAGIKVSPYFRFYIKRNKSYGVYVQAAVIIAYFDFSRLNYNYENSYTKSVETNFWTGGIGGAFGITDIVRNSKHFIVDINVGWQLLPSLYPTKITDEYGITYTHNNTWWAVGGPGSIVEIKLAIGGIF